MCVSQPLLCACSLMFLRSRFTSLDKCSTGHASPVNNSASFSAVFTTPSASPPWAAPPWPPQRAPIIMPPGAMPSPPAGAIPNGALSTPTGHQLSQSSNATPNPEIGCKRSEVHRCDHKGKLHSDASKNTHIQILSGDIVDLRALSAVYGSGLCPAILTSPLHRAYSHKHCDCPNEKGHTSKNTKCHKQPRSGFGPRHKKTWDSVLAWKPHKKKHKGVAAKGKKKK